MQSVNVLHEGIEIKSSKFDSSQGSVYFVEDAQGEQRVLKIYSADNQDCFQMESNILDTLQKRSEATGLQVAPKIISTRHTPTQSEILMEALSTDLRKAVRSSPGDRVCRASAFAIAIQLMKLIRELHDIGYIHNDLKLENILIGKSDPSKIHLIDFGLCQQFMQPDGVTHIEKEFINKFSGNIMFASLNSCRGNTKSRRDDVQSVFFILVYLLWNMNLPWKAVHAEFRVRGVEFKEYLKERLNISHSKAIYRSLDTELKALYKMVTTLKFEQTPPYDEIIELFQSKFEEELKKSDKPTHSFEWVWQQQVDDAISRASASQFHVRQYRERQMNMRMYHLQH